MHLLIHGCTVEEALKAISDFSRSETQRFPSLTHVIRDQCL